MSRCAEGDQLRRIFRVWRVDVVCGYQPRHVDQHGTRCRLTGQGMKSHGNLREMMGNVECR